jgi:hypothetical protein
MTTFSKTTAFALVAIFSLNAVVASAQTVETPRQPTQGRVVAGVHFPKATLVVRAQEVQTGADQNRPTFDLKWPKTRIAAPVVVTTPIVTAPTPTAAPTSATPEWPCGTVAWDSNNVPIANSTSC